MTEIILSKLTSEERQKLNEEAERLGPKHVEALQRQEARQAQYILVE